MKTPLSLHDRLLIASALTILLFLSATAWIIYGVVNEVIVRNLNAKIDAQIALIELAEPSFGRFQPNRAEFVSDFRVPQTRWGWRVIGSTAEWKGGNAFGTTDLDRNTWQQHDGAVSGQANSPAGPVHVRVRSRNGLTVEVAAPEELLITPLWSAMRPTLAALILLAGVLLASAVVQLRVALRPLRSLGECIADVRCGAADTLPEQQPRELLPLTNQIRDLIAQNASNLGRARNHVSNLAHGLKTPLATLALRLAREGASSDTKSIVSDMDRRIGHHLNRARWAANSIGYARTTLAPVVHSLVRTLGQIYEDRFLRLIVEVDENLSLKMERQDLDETLGNILDNACRFARTMVSLVAQAERDGIRIVVEDDGPGIAQDEIATAIKAGTRLDESGRGYGFGLGIAHELITLYGGTLKLQPSSRLGGLEVGLFLP